MENNIQVSFKMSFDDWGLLDNCLVLSLYFFERKRMYAKLPFNKQEEFIVSWIEEVQNQMRIQVEESTTDVSLDILKPAMASSNDTTQLIAAMSKHIEELIWQTIITNSK